MRDLPSETISACGRVIEEGIANAVRHGEAQHVDVSIDAVDRPTRPLRLTIVDDGHGLQ